MHVQTDLSKEHKTFLHGVFTTALEGGIDYWSECSSYKWSLVPTTTPDIDGFYAAIRPPAEEGCWGVFDDDESDRSAQRIDLEVIYRGVELFKDYCYGKVDGNGNPVPDDDRTPIPEDHYWRQFLVAELTRGDGGDYDAEVADLIVQFGLFGKVVYA